MSNVASYIVALNVAFDSRALFEAQKNEANENIQKTIKDIRKSMTRESVASVLLASNVSADFVNESIRVDSKYNVYAAQKVDNLACFILKAESLNHYTLAILRSLLSLEKNEMQLTHEDAKSACTLEMKLKDAKREKLLIKYQKHVAISTANTQSSSSLEALCTFNVLKRSRNAENETVFTLCDNDATREILARIA